jgi:hypothetical protein
MTNEIFEELKEAYVEHLKEMMLEEGTIYPVITIFADHIEDTEGRGAIVHLPIPAEYMQTSKKKDEFIEEMLPQIAEQMREKFIPYAVAWSAEAWMRIVDKKKDELFEPSINKEEGIIINIETDDKTETLIYKIIRNMNVEEKEGLKETITLEKMDDIPTGTGEGRFTGLLKKFKHV